MSDLTPEAALRVSAEHLSKRYGASDMVLTLIAEADRLEAAAKTPGQVAFEMTTVVNPRPGWGEIASETQAYWERIAAAVIAHHVGADRIGPGQVVVDREYLGLVLRHVDDSEEATSAVLISAIRLREDLK